MVMWITVKNKVLGIFFIMLGLIVVFQAANYFLTLRSVRDLEEFYGNALERNEILDLKHSLYEKLLALDNYALFPDKSHLGQLRYTDKAFVKKIDELRARPRFSGSVDRTALLDKIKTLDDSHNREVGLLVKVHKQGGPDNAAAAGIGKVESIENDMRSDFDLLLAGFGEGGTDRDIKAGRSRLIDIETSHFNPMREAGRDIHADEEELTDYLRIRNLLMRRAIARRRFLITGQDRYVEDFNERGTELGHYLNEAIAIPVNNKGRKKEVFENAKRLNGQITSVFNQAVLTYRSGDKKKAVAVVMGAFLDNELLVTALDDLVDEEKAEVNSTYAALTPTMNYAVSLSKLILIYILLIAGVMSVITYAVVSRMVGPITDLADVAQKIAHGDWTKRVQVRSRDEIGKMARSFNQMTDNLENAEKTLLKNQLEVSALYDVSRALGRTIDLDTLLAEILSTITKIEVFNIERKGAIFLVEGSRMKLVSHIGESPAFTHCKEINVGDCLCGLAALTKEVVVSMNSTEDERHTTRLPHVGAHGHIVVPLKAMDKVVGVLCLYVPAGVEIDEDKKTMLYILGAQIGIAISNAKLYEETKALSLRDALTGLANRRLMDIMLEKSFGRAKRLGSPFSCIMLDIDFFKKYNDTYGHPAGDSLLVKLAQIILKEVRDIDLVARYGGEEFFILFPDITLPEARNAAERIRTSVEAEAGVTISLGVSTYFEEAQQKEEVIKKADEALYQAKQNGRNRVEVSVI